MTDRTDIAEKLAERCETTGFNANAYTARRHGARSEEGELLLEAASLIRSQAAALEASQARCRELEEGVHKIARGPVQPAPDPGAHSWSAYANFWRAETLKLMNVARALLTGEKP